MGAVTVSVLVLVVANVVLILMILTRRAWVARAKRRHDKLVKLLRPAAILLLESDPPQPPPRLQGGGEEVFAELLAGYGRQLRGESKMRIAAYFESSGAVDDQIGRLRNRRAWRRAAAAFTLGDMASERAVPELLRMLSDRARDVRMAATRSLGRVRAVEAIGPLVAAGVSGRVPRDVANLALLDIGPPAVPKLVELSSHAEPVIRSSAVELIGLLGAAGDAEPLLDHLTDPAAAVRVTTAGALGRLGAADARDALMDALDDRIPAVRAAAANALGQIGGRQATQALLPIARTDTFEPARAAAEALSRIDPAMVIRAATEPDAGAHLREAADRARL